MPATLSRLSLLAFIAATLSASDGYAGKPLPIKGVYGDEHGCRFRKHGTIESDIFTYVAKDGIHRYESRCSFLDITNVKDDFPETSSAWNVRAICHAEGIPYPEDVLILEGKDMDGRMSLNLQFKDMDNNQTLYPCK